MRCFCHVCYRSLYFISVLFAVQEGLGGPRRLGMNSKYSTQSLSSGIMRLRNNDPFSYAIALIKSSLVFNEGKPFLMTF